MVVLEDLRIFGNAKLEVTVVSDRPQRLVEAPLPVGSALVRARVTNRGRVRIGDASVMRSDPGLEPGRALGLRGDPRVDLASVFVAADVEGDGVEVVYAA